MNKARFAIAAAALVVAPWLMAGSCLQTGKLEGTITDQINNPGPTMQIRVKTLVDQPAIEQPWVEISDEFVEACNIGDRYPDCTQ